MYQSNVRAITCSDPPCRGTDSDQEGCTLHSQNPQDPLRVVFVCLGNICRSPLAEGIFAHKVAQVGQAHRFSIDSAGTSAYHVGEAPDPGSIRVARKHGIDIGAQRSRQFVREDLERWDYLIAMDRNNHRDMMRMMPNTETWRGRLWLARNFELDEDGAGFDQDVPDPWGGGVGGFAQVYQILDTCCDHLMTHLLRQGTRRD